MLKKYIFLNFPIFNTKKAGECRLFYDLKKFRISSLSSIAFSFMKFLSRPNAMA